MIIWVDDDISAGLIPFVEAVQDGGYKIIMIKNPDDIWEPLKRSDIYGIIMDVSLPTGNRISIESSQSGILTGLELMKELKENCNYSSIPLIILTIVTNHEVTIWAENNGILLLRKQDVLPRELLSAVKSQGILTDENEQ